MKHLILVISLISFTGCTTTPQQQEHIEATKKLQELCDNMKNDIEKSNCLAHVVNAKASIAEDSQKRSNFRILTFFTGIILIAMPLF